MIDAHCHLDLYPHPTRIAHRADRSGVLTVMVTNLPSAFESALPYVREFSQIRPALGLHPLLAERHASELQRFRELVDSTSYIGEVGLDFSSSGKTTKELQIESFRFVLTTLQSKPKFVTVHSRRAESAVLDILEEVNFESPVVFHWYSGGLGVVDRIVKGGHYFSVNPAMVQSPKGGSIIDRIPLDRLLTETDGPFVKVRGRVVEPSDVNLVEAYLSEAWSISQRDVRSKVRENFMKLVLPIRTIKQTRS